MATSKIPSVEAIPDSAITRTLGTAIFSNKSWCDKSAVNLNFEVAQVSMSTTNTWAQIAVLDEKYRPSTTCFGFGLSTNGSYLNPKFCLVQILSNGKISVMNTENSNNYYFIQCYFNRA